MQCPSCNKFPAKDTDTEPEGDLDVDEEGHVTGEIRIVNTSECCGEELEETNFSVDIDLTDEVAAHKAKHHPEPDKPVKKKKVPPLKLTDPWAMCRNCKRGYRTHVAPGTKHQLDEHPRAWPADARTCRCTTGWDDHKGTRGTVFEPKVKSDTGTDDMDLSLDSDISRTDESPMTDRKGRNITQARYRKRFYGIDVSVTLTCTSCAMEVAKGTFSDSVQASGMESLV